MDLPYDQIQAITHDAIEEMIAAGIFTGHAYLNRVMSKAKEIDGGNQLLLPLMTVDDTGSTGGFYSPRDNLSLEEYDGLSSSVHAWKYLYESCVIYKADIAKNQSSAGVKSIIVAKTEQMKKAMKQRFLKALLSDGTNATGSLSNDQFIGLDAIIDSTTTYASIAPADVPHFVSFVDSNSGTPRALTREIWNNGIDEATEEGVGRPSVGLMRSGVFTKARGLLEANERIMAGDSVDGFGHAGQALRYSGVDFLMENQCPANTIWGYDEEYIKMYYLKGQNMRMQSIQDLETADAQLDRVFFYGAFAARERKFAFAIEDITEA